MKYYLKSKHFYSRKCIWICRLQNGNHLVSTEMRFNDCFQCWSKGINASDIFQRISLFEISMVYFRVTLDQRIVVLTLNFTGQLINHFLKLGTNSLVLANVIHFTKYCINSWYHHCETICYRWPKGLQKTPSNRYHIWNRYHQSYPNRQ